VSSFLREGSCTLVYQGAPGTPAPVYVGAPQGSPISPLLCLIYVAPLHFGLPLDLRLSCVDNLPLTAASRRCSEPFRPALFAWAYPSHFQKQRVFIGGPPAKGTYRCGCRPFTSTGNSFTPGTPCGVSGIGSCPPGHHRPISCAACCWPKRPLV